MLIQIKKVIDNKQRNEFMKKEINAIYIYRLNCNYNF